ncbi:hypothetical protein RRG08_055783 [Elysia crispata]|uniref:Uncharacterized protein n=1 Tax=Elysia crispata TaxID=231223 RepID=A0AAE0XSD9_9GAST|nr:hypothetical protein RRG08_055783 [Elysia crispata]
MAVGAGLEHPLSYRTGRGPNNCRCRVRASALISYRYGPQCLYMQGYNIRSDIVQVGTTVAVGAGLQQPL